MIYLEIKYAVTELSLVSIKSEQVNKICYIVNCSLHPKHISGK